MTDRDINIHARVQGAEEAKQRLDNIGRSSESVGKKTVESQRGVADSTEKATQKLGAMERITQILKTQVMGLVTAWLGIRGVQVLIDWLIRKLERIAELQRTILERSLDFAQIGQALEMQTGTSGQQQYWAQQAAKLQAAGGLISPGAAQQLAVSADIAFAVQGGIKSPQVMAMLMQLAPFVGAQQMGAGQVAKLFEFAGAAGIAPTPQAYKDYFAKLQAGYTTSVATDFGQYMLGLQKGVTPYIAQGGTLAQGISAFVGARAVSPTEDLAATLVEQITRLSSGAYEKPRKAMERALGIKWETLSMDERTMALLQYVGGISEASRNQVLAAQGFPIELTTRIGTMVSPKAMEAMGAAGQAIGDAGAPQVEQLTKDYLRSVIGRQRVTAGQIALKRVKAAPQFADWQTRLDSARTDFEIALAEGQDRWVRDSIEPYVIAIEGIQKDLEEQIKTIPEGEPRQKAEMLRERIQLSLSYMTFRPSELEFLPPLLYPRGWAAKRGYEFSRELQEFGPTTPVVVNNYHNDVVYNRPIGPASPRFTQD